MEKSVVFIDIDGTLSGDDGLNPHSAVYACKQAMKNGHSLYLCTGRSKPEIFPEIMEIGFHGLIGAGGGFAQVNGEDIYHKTVDSKDVKHVVDYFDAYEIPFYMESNGGLYASKTCVPVMISIMENMGISNVYEHPFMKILIQGETNFYRDDVNKFCFLENPKIPFIQIKKEFDDSFEVHHCTVPVFGENSGELAVAGVNKGLAIEALLKHTGEQHLNRIAIGDGLNDIDMFEVCNTTIAMGNAKQGLKDIADYITDDVEHDGLKNAFEHVGLI